MVRVQDGAPEGAIGIDRHFCCAFGAEVTDGSFATFATQELQLPRKEPFEGVGNRALSRRVRTENHETLAFAEVDFGLVGHSAKTTHVDSGNPLTHAQSPRRLFGGRLPGASIRVRINLSVPRPSEEEFPRSPIGP